MHKLVWIAHKKCIHTSFWKYVWFHVWCSTHVDIVSDQLGTLPGSSTRLPTKCVQSNGPVLVSVWEMFCLLMALCTWCGTSSACMHTCVCVCTCACTHAYMWICIIITMTSNKQICMKHSQKQKHYSGLPQECIYTQSTEMHARLKLLCCQLSGSTWMHTILSLWRFYQTLHISNLCWLMAFQKHGCLFSSCGWDKAFSPFMCITFSQCYMYTKVDFKATIM